MGGWKEVNGGGGGGLIDEIYMNLGVVFWII